MTWGQTLGVLFGIFVAVMALTTIIQAAKTTNWRANIRAAPSYVLAAWNAQQRNLGLACVLIATGLPGILIANRYLIPIPNPNIVEIILVLLPIFAFFGGLLVFLGAVISICHHLFTGDLLERGIETVLQQRVHDTGQFAREAAIDAALRDEAERTPDFPQIGE
jgi:hypothetical protein